MKNDISTCDVDSNDAQQLTLLSKLTLEDLTRFYWVIARKWRLNLGETLSVGQSLAILGRASKVGVKLRTVAELLATDIIKHQVDD